MINWRRAYNGLCRAGYTDDQIAELAGVTRGVINGVRNGTYNHPHEPLYSGGVRILQAITDALHLGYLVEDPLVGEEE